MTMRVLKLRCYHADCANDEPLEIRIEVPRWSRASSATKEKTVQCERGHYNIIAIPANWEVRNPVLGDDEVIGYDESIPIVQGRPG